MAGVSVNVWNAKRHFLERVLGPVSLDLHLILDNGKGMTRDILGEALRLAADMDQITGNTQSRKGMYGLGMKIACSSLGSH